MSNSPLSVVRFKVIFSICWLLLMTDHAMVLHWLDMSWKVSIIDSVISNILLLLPCLLVMSILRYYLPQRGQYINVFAWCILLTLVWFFLSKWLLQVTLGNNEAYSSLLGHSLSIRFSIGFLILGCITMISVLWYNWGEQKEMEDRKADTEKLSKEAELFKLRHQLQPHFLFNSLNSINALIGVKPAEARKMVQQLSDFLRGTIRKDELQWVTLKEELQYLQLYLDIEKVRFGHRLSAVVECDEATDQMQLPALLLQPIMENAIKFGLYDTIDDIIIHLSAYKEENNLVIKIINPFDPETSAPKQGTGFGLESVQRRLYLLFARTGLLITEVHENTFTTIVKIPQP